MAEKAESQSGYITGVTNFNAAERRGMSETHAHQAIAICEGEIPNCVSVHTLNVLSGALYKQASERTKIIGRFDLMDNSIIIIHKLETNTLDYHIIDENLSGFRARTKISSSDKILKRGDFIIENESDEGFISIGKNALIGLKIHENTLEDMIQVSQSFADKTHHLETKTYDIHITEDYEFVNLSENEEEFLPILPYADGKLLITRKRNELNFNSFTIDKLNEDDPLRNYKEFEGYGKTDVKVYLNENNLKNLPNTRTWNWLKQKHEENIEIHKEFVEFIQNYTNEEVKLSVNLFNLVNYYADFVNGFTIYDKRDLVCLVRINTEKKVKLKTGSKLTNTHGTKGLIKVVPDSEMPYLEDGTVLDLVINSDTVISRMNLSQIREMEINSVREYFESNIKNATTIEEKSKIFITFMKEVCKLDYNYSDAVSEDLFDENFKLLSVIDRIDTSVFNKYKPDIVKTLFNPKTKQPYKNKCVVGRNYIFQLKHEPTKKTSAVALAYENASGFPTRSSKRDYLVIGDKPSQLGYMECSHFMVSGNEILNELIKIRSYSKNTREFLAKEMLIKDGDILQDNIPLYSNSAKEFFKQITICLGIDLGLKN